MKNDFGTYVRDRREALREDDRSSSVRQVATRVGIEPSYLFKTERGQQPTPGEKTIIALANEFSTTRRLCSGNPTDRAIH